MIVSADWLYGQLENDVVIVDARHDLFDEEKGRRQYEDDHIPGAVFLDMASEMADKSKKAGGRYPMPSIERIGQVFREKGVTNQSLVVVYDAQSGGMAAGRAWMMLNYLGHKRVAILDGGINSWKELGYPTTTEVPIVKPTNFELNVDHSFLLTAEEVHRRLGESIFIDARAEERFIGGDELLDAKAGHIPGALNYYWKGVLNHDGGWKNAEELADHFKDVPRDKEIIVYCGSGISACPNVLALKAAGFHHVKLYPGSWSDWITHEDYPIETGKGKKE